MRIVSSERRFDIRLLIVALHCALLIAGPGGPAAADCNQNDVDDATDIAAGTSEDCDENRVPDECEIAPLEFGSDDRGFEYSVIPALGATADVDGDGIADLVTAHENGTLSVVLNQGDATFGEVAEFPTGASGRPRAMQVLDLNGDGHADVVLLSFSSSIHVLLNNGDGTFGDATRFSVQRAFFLNAAELTGDGVPDLITTHANDDRVSLFPGLGDGTFLDPIESDVSDAPGATDAGDLDGDGDLDLVVTDRSGNVTVLPNNGDGAFSVAGSFGIGASTSSAVRVGDLDEDGDVDVAVATISSLAILMNDGTGAFGAPIAYGGRATALTIDDVDGDGDLDVASVSTDSSFVSVLVHQGGGQFSSVLAPIYSPATTVNAADLDGDGAPDLFVTSGTRPRASILWSGRQGVIPVTLVPTSYPVGRVPPHGGTIGDMNDDGYIDVITGNGSGDGVSVLLNNRDGTLAPPTVYSIESDYQSVAVDDLDDDGDLDVVGADQASNQLAVFRNDGNGALTGPRNWPCGSFPIMVAIADLDVDGHPDLISANERANTVTLLFNAGDGSFPDRQDLSVGNRPMAVAAADLDGDGDLEIASSNVNSRSLSVIFNRGDRLFDQPVDYPVRGRAFYVTAADLDGDGDVDVATANASTDHIAVFLNEGDGTFPEPRTFPLFQPPVFLAAGDFDSDGVLDISTASDSVHIVSLLFGNGDGTFGPPFEYKAGRNPEFAYPVDLELDGDTDMVIVNHTSNDVTVLLNHRATADFSGTHLERICTEIAFRGVSTPSSADGIVERATKYTVPARDYPQLLPVLFQNVNRFPLHREFLEAAFPERFPALTVEEYNRLVGLRATRDYYSGVIVRLLTADGPAYGFSVVTDTSSRDELLTLDETQAVYETLRGAFRLEPLGYFPRTTSAREAASEWRDASFPIFDEDGSTEKVYQAYTRAVGYGRVRLLKEAEFETANSRGEISFQSVLVLERAPSDIEGVVGGVITAEPQGELSHLSIRTARRRTPNAFVADALSAFESFAGQLVRLEVKDGEYLVREATLEEAQEFWAANRPELTELPALDTTFGELSSLAEIAALDQTSPQESRFGGKATNLARLGLVLEGSPFEHLRESGFGIPARYYEEFMRANQLPSAVDPARQVTYEEYIQELLTLEEFQSDSTFRFGALDGFRDVARDEGVVSAELVDRLIARIPEIFPSTGTAVRFRSSSNVEDALEFNGAGLYESTGACADDDLDANDTGPSLCDPTKSGERDIPRALKKVWTSLWTFRAYEERAFYGIPPEQVGMGILVSRSFLEERANGVAFTGNLANALDKRYVVTVQLGEESVVSPDPGVRAEKDVLEVVDGKIARIVRPENGSSLVPPGQWILSDAHLEELGGFMAFVDANFPIDLGNYEREQVLLDMEFKLERDDGSLAVKQIRPFLISGPVVQTPTFAVEIPEGTMACGVFGLAGVGRGPSEEYELKSTVRFRGGRIELPTRDETFTEDLVEEVRFGPAREVAEPLERGLFRVVRFPLAGGVTTYRFVYEQDFALDDGGVLELRMVSPLDFRAGELGPLETIQVLPDDFFVKAPGNEALVGNIGGESLVRYGDCTYESLPRWQTDVETADGTTLRLVERFLPSENAAGTGPASLVWAEVVIDGGLPGEERRVVSDYWNLVYSAFRHNAEPRYWVIFDTPVSVPGIAKPVKGVEFAAGDPVAGVKESVRYLGEGVTGFVVLKEPAVITAKRERLEDEPEVTFIRGDVNADGTVNAADAVSLLAYLFRGGATPECQKSADTNDNGRVSVTDAVSILLHLFGGAGPLPEPFASCGTDPSPDVLTCGSFGQCP